MGALGAALGRNIEVVRGRVEEVALPELCDVLVSEPMGTLLVNERMLETYLYARDHLLKPGGRMFPVRPFPATRPPPACPACCLRHIHETLKKWHQSIAWGSAHMR